MREINFEDYPEQQRFTINRMERLDQARELVPVTPLEKTLKNQVIFSLRQDLSALGQKDLADFILNTPVTKP